MLKHSKHGGQASAHDTSSASVCPLLYFGNLFLQQCNLRNIKHFAVVVAIYQVNDYFVFNNIINVSIAVWGGYEVADSKFHK
jgi:hypothetical protein